MRTAGHADLDDPRATIERRLLIQRKGFLRQLYLDWYRAILDAVPPGTDPILEIGSGGGFLPTVDRRVITSDVLAMPHIDVTADAMTLPFASRSLSGVVMTNVLHHVADPEAFFAEAARCISPDGAIVMVEPWLTHWSRLVYRHLHHEPLLTGAASWTFPRGGPLSAANIALPWILFERDKDAFHNRCAPWRVTSVTRLMPFSYLVSGGVSWPGFLPGAAYKPWRWMERHLLPNQRWAMFALIVLRKQR